jgi:hypothetical protein
LMICTSRSIARAYAEQALGIRNDKPWFKGCRDKGSRALAKA